jgi:hypothetical protein
MKTTNKPSPGVETLFAGAATADLTPRTSQFLCGYPHVPRMSEGVHDPLLSSALYLAAGSERVLLIANDILFIPNTSVPRVREAIVRETGMAADHILLSATHTHSGPKVTEPGSKRENPVDPPVDPDYIRQLEGAIIQAACAAVRAARPARAAFACADATGIGTNRHDPHGPADHQVPVLVVRDAKTEAALAVMLVCSMHPTVMHEDSRLVSADFPGMCRDYLHAHVTGPECVILHHTGCAGNQSPRHVTRANTFAEAERLGGVLGRAVERAIAGAQPMDDVRLGAVSTLIDPPRRHVPPVGQAEQDLAAARARFEELKRTGPRTEARTAECDVFGAEHRLNLARMAAEDTLEAAYAACTPAEIQVIRIGPLCFAGWPAEVYVEYGLRLKALCPGAFPIAIANGRLAGYITTPEAVEARHYEAGAALFEPRTGDLFVETTRQLMAQL